jgi:hypothetical protein
MPVILVKGEVIRKITCQTGKLQLFAREGKFAGHGESLGATLVNLDFLMSSARSQVSFTDGPGCAGEKRKG